MTARRPALPGAWAEVLAAPAFVINLDRAPERLGPVLARLAAAGFTDVRRVRGVDGLVPAELAAAWAAFGNPYFRDDNRPDALLPGKPGMQGAYLSHALLWRRIVEENIPFCTIFEDDAAFHRGWADLAPAYYAATPPDADAVWLGSWAFGAEMQGIMALPLPVVGLFATLLTREGARQMLELSVGNPLGVFAFDSMVRNAQFAVSSGNRPPFRWSVWTRPEREDPGFPPFEPVHNPAHGLVRSIQDDSSAQMNVAPARLQRALAAAAQEANSARGLLAADRLRCLHDLDPAMTDHARREQLALVRALGDGVGDGGAAPAIAIAPHPVATAPATPAVAAVPMDAPRSGLPATWQEVLDAPAFVINLDRTPDRMEQMLVRLAEAGFTDVRRVRGVDGLIPADLERGWAALGDPPLSEACIEPNRLGGRPCLQAAFASHGLLWRRIVDEGIPFCTIFEDDAAFHAGWADLAPGYYAETPRGAEVVWLGSWAFGADLTDAKVVTMPVLGFNSLLVSNAGARRLLDLTIGDPAGAYAFDCMVRDRQYAMLERGDRALDWVAWSRPAAEDPAFPPFHPWTYPAFGLAHSLRNESTAQLDEGAGRLVNTLRAAGESGNLAQGRLALDRLRCLHDLEPNLTADARRAQLAYIRPLGAAAASPATAAAPKPAAAPPAAPALLPETWREVLAAPAFFINLDRMPERRGLMKRRLAAAGFSDIRRVRGVDGLVPAELGPAWAALGNPSFREGVTPPTDELAGRPGLQGAFTSHGLLWRRIVEEQIPVCTIFEDDARFDPRWADLAPRFHAVTPRDAEVVWMGAFEPGMDLRGIRAESFPIIGLYACIVTLDGARRLLEATVGDPRGVYAFDSMISASQFRFLRDGGPRPMRWSVWTMPDEDAPGFPPFHPWDYPAFGLVHPGVDDSAAQMDQAPIRLLRSIERSHAAGDLAAGRLACDRLRCLHDIEDAMTDHARRNQLFYTEAQDALADGVRRVRIDPGMPPGAVLDPPALVADPNGGAVLVVQGALGDAFHTRWLRLGPDGLPLGPGRPVQSPFAAVRLAPFRDRLIAAGLVPGPMPGDPPRFALAAASASFGASGTDGEAAAAGELGFGQPIAFGEPDPALWRGPWPLAVAGEDVRVLRSFGPAASLRLDPAQGELLPAATHAGPRLAEDLTGSAPLVPFGDGWLAIAREDAAFPGGPPLDRPFSAWSVYQPDVIALHRLAAFDADLRMTRISHPFVFAALGHEACGGLAIIGDRLVMAWDNARDETWLSIMPLAEAERLLIPVENLMLAGRWPAGL